MGTVLHVEGNYGCRDSSAIDDDAPKGLLIVVGNAVVMPVEYVLNNTFGFGGHTASSVFRKYRG